MAEDTITINKNDLWKYSTFLLLAVVVIGGIVVFTGGSSSITGNAVGNTGGNTGNVQQQQGPVDLSVFENNPNRYPSIGPEDADTVVVEFSDFQCPYCALASGIPSWTSQFAGQYADLIGSAGKVKALAEQGKVRFIYVPMSFLGEESVYTAQAALCANKQGKFWEMHDAIFAASTGPQENDGRYEKDKLKTIAASVSGIDTKAFNTCLDTDATLADVKKASSEASTVATGTPTFYVNGQKFSASWTQLSAAIGA